MEFYTNVTKRQYSNGKGLPNYGVYDAKARIQKAERLRKAEAERVAAMTEAAEIKRNKAEEEAARYTLEAYKRTVINELSTYIPLLVMNEGFTRIMMEAMPHDDSYKEEHKAAIETVNRIWLHHLGGFKYLKEQANATGSSFLQNWYSWVKEDSQAILDDKIEAIQNAHSETEVNNIVKSGITSDQAEKIDRDIDSMGPDQIATMVQNKVLDVVKDESKKQSEDAAFRAEMANRAKEYEEQENDKGDATVADANQPEAVEDNDDATSKTSDDEGGKPEEAAEDNKEVKVDTEVEDPKTEAAKLARYMINPVILHEHSLLYSMVNSIYHEMVNTVKEDNDVAVVGNERIAPIQIKSTQTSPLVMTSFDDFLNDYQDDMRHVDNLRIANKAAIAGDETRIDSEDVLAEALTQYTMLETAMTIKLITPTPKEVREAAQAYMKY